MEASTFTVVYGVGGYLDTVWHQCQPCATIEQARAQRDEIVRAGRPAYSGETHWWKSVGLPDGAAPDWDYDKLQWRR